jgi:hypothetical protein
LLFFPGSLKFAGMQPQPHCQQTVYPGRRKNSGPEDLVGKPFPPIIRHSALSLFLILSPLTTCLLRVSGREHGVPITRNTAWNDLLDQFDTGRTNASNESVSSDLLLIQKFVKEHKTEVTVESTSSRFSEPSTTYALVFRRPTKTWKPSARPSPTKNSKPGT